MKKFWVVLSSLLLLTLLSLSLRFWWQPQQVEAAPTEQGLMQLPLDFYILLNQSGDLWLVRINLADVYLRDVNLANANLREANLSRANLSGANLEGARLRGAILNSADFRNVTLEGADLGWASMVNTDLRGANLGGAILQDTNLTNAKYDNTTIWPEEFDVTQTKAVLVKEPTPSPVPTILPTPESTSVP